MIKRTLPLIIFLIILCLGTHAREELKPVLTEQQKAIHQIIGAMKHFKKMRSDGQGQQSQGRSLFKDKQEFKMPEFKKEDSLEHNLESIIQQQEQTLQQMRQDQNNQGEKGSQQDDEGKTQNIQKDIIQKLQNIKDANNSSGLSDKEQQQLQDAKSAAQDSHKAMQSHDRDIAKIKQEQSKAYLNQILEGIQNASDKRTDEVLAQAQKKINDLQKQTAEKGATDEIKKEVEGMSQKLMQQAEHEHKNGRIKNAEELAELAREMHEGISSKGDTEKQLENIRKEIAQKRAQRNGNSLQQALDSLKNLRKQLNYAQKHQQAMDPSQLQELKDDIELAMQDAKQALEQSIGDSDNNQSSSSSNNPNSDQQNNASQTSGDNNKPDGASQSGAGNKGSNEANKKSGNGGASNDKRELESHIRSFVKLIKDIDKFFQRNAPPLFISGTRVRELDNSMRELVYHAEKINQMAAKKPNVYYFSEDDIPLKYRKSVARYFQCLSEGRGK